MGSAGSMGMGQGLHGSLAFVAVAADSSSPEGTKRVHRNARRHSDRTQQSECGLALTLTLRHAESTIFEPYGAVSLRFWVTVRMVLFFASVPLYIAYPPAHTQDRDTLVWVQQEKMEGGSHSNQRLGSSASRRLRGQQSWWRVRCFVELEAVTMK